MRIFSGVTLAMLFLCGLAAFPISVAADTNVGSTKTSATPPSPRSNRPPLRRKLSPRASPKPRSAQKAGLPVAFGGAKPRVTVSRDLGPNQSVGSPDIQVLTLSSPDNPTAYRIANSIRELPTVDWLPYEKFVEFVPNGLFPAQAVVQVGKPAGPGMHPVHGGLVKSDPVVLALAGFNSPGRFVAVESFGGGPYTLQTGVLQLRLPMMGEDTRNAKIDNLSVCGNFFKSEQPKIYRAAYGGGFIVRVPGIFMVPAKGCRVRMGLLADGGNFDPGARYYLDDTDETFEIEHLPTLVESETYRSPLRPKFDYEFALTTSKCEQGETSDGKYFLEMSSGPLPSTCQVRSRELLIPEQVRVSAFNWKVRRILPGTNRGFHCSHRADLPDGETRNWYRMVSDQKTDYFHVTTGTHPMLPGEVLAEADEDLSKPRRREWVLPLEIRLSCQPYVGNDGKGGPGFDRIRMVLDSIEYRANPSTKGSAH